MPYITDDAKMRLMVGDLPKPETPGELNYCLTTLCLEYLELQASQRETGPNYEQFNAVVGALECAKLELTRRMVVPYEETKIAENGDVYPPTNRGGTS